jgi:hypothetical protein
MKVMVRTFDIFADAAISCPQSSPRRGEPQEMTPLVPLVFWGTPYIVRKISLGKAMNERCRLRHTFGGKSIKKVN